MNKWLACQILASIESQGVRKFTVQCTNPAIAESFKIWVLTPDLTVSSSAGPSPEPIRTMKVLWHDETGTEQENESDMKKFLTESEINFSKDQMEQLLRALQTNSLWVPEGARELQGWKVGLLERFTNKDLATWSAEVCMR
jgi:ubiquitin-protein ligase E3 D